MISKLSTGRKTKTHAAIYFDQDFLKWMIKNNSHDNEYAQIGLVPLAGKSDQDITDLIKRHLPVGRLSQADLRLALPRNLATIKSVTLPSARGSELNAMIEFQVPRLVPYPRSEIIYDYQGLSSTPNDTLVRIAVVHRKSVDKYFSFLSKAGIFPSSVHLCSDTVHSTYFEKEHSGSFLELDYTQSHWVFFEDGRIRFSRSIPLGAKHLTETSDTGDIFRDFLNQLEASMSLFLTSESWARTTLHLLGAAKAMDLLETPIAEKLKVKILRERTNILSKTWIGEEWKDSLSLTGLHSILSKNDLSNELNLIPKDMQERFEQRQKLDALKKLGLAAAGVFFLGAAVYANELSRHQKELNLLNQNIRSIQAEATELEDLKRKGYLLKYHVEHRGDCLRIFSSLVGNIPDEVYLKNVGLDTNKVTLKGYASNLSQIFEFTSILQKNALFNKIDTQYARQGESGKHEMAEFHLECWLKSDLSERQNDVQPAQ